MPIFGSQRKSYIIIGAALMALGLLILAGAAGGWLTFARANQLYLLGAMLLVIGTVMQDVVADAMSTEVVPRVDAAGHARPDNVVRIELGMVQVLGRLAVSCGILAVAGLSGLLANVMPRHTVFLLGLIIPAISVIGVFLRGHETVERRPIDWRILGGGLVYGGVVIVLGIGSVPFAQEIIFVISMAVVCAMLVLVTQELDHRTRMGILFTTIIVFAFRATPLVGDGFFWWTLDELNFDAAFYGVLRQTGAVLSIIVMWLFSRQLTEYSVTKTLFWIVVLSTLLALPNIGLVYGLHVWTEATFGFGARGIALVDAAAASPFVQLSMIPLLTLIAYYAPPGHRATWFALMASLMNLAHGGLAARDQIPQRRFRAGARPVCRAWPAADLGGGARLHHSGGDDYAVRPPGRHPPGLEALSTGAKSHWSNARAVRPQLLSLRRPGREAGRALLPRGHAPVRPDRRAGLHPHPAGRALLQAVRRLQPEPAAVPHRRRDADQEHPADHRRGAAGVQPAAQARRRDRHARRHQRGAAGGRFCARLPAA